MTNGCWNQALLVLAAVVLLQACDTGAEQGVEVIEYDGPPITHESLMYELWAVEIDSIVRTATIEHVDPDGDIHYRFHLHEVPGELPAFAGFIYHPESEYSTRMRSGTIEIQNFDLEGEISGRLEGEFRNGSRIGGIFWVHADSQRAESSGSDHDHESARGAPIAHITTRFLF